VTKTNAPSLVPFARRSPARGGFTILEILIAAAILAVGLVMILGLFPFGIKVGREIVEDTTAINIARSVADAIRVGMRNNLRYRTSRSDTTYTYFVFQHDGVQDPVPNDFARESPAHDYFILLPRHRHGRSFDGRSDAERREKAINDRGAKTFVYPESDPDPSSGPGARANGGGDPFVADDDQDDFLTEHGYRDFLVRRTYNLGNTLPDHGDTGPQVLEDQKDDVMKQYSYAFAIRESYFDSNLSENPRIFEPGNELYHVTVMVFRAFEQNFYEAGPETRRIDPVFVLDFEVAR
jgi:prepilin-type N-terminal cleavage/methylation domain-containing protein